jgi:hypothetical protein
MFAIVDKETMRVVGTTHTAEPSDTQYFVPVSREQYVQFIDDPVLMSSTKATLKDDVVTLDDSTES